VALWIVKRRELADRQLAAAAVICSSVNFDFFIDKTSSKRFCQKLTFCLDHFSGMTFLPYSVFC